MDRFRTIPQVRAAVKAALSLAGEGNFVMAPPTCKSDPQTYTVTIAWKVVLFRASRVELLAWANKNL